MKTIPMHGWNVVQSCVVCCIRCGDSTVDHPAGTATEAVARARNDGWRILGGGPVCPKCLLEGLKS